MDYLCSECSTQLSKFEIELNKQFPIGKLYCEFCQNEAIANCNRCEAFVCELHLEYYFQGA